MRRSRVAGALSIALAAFVLYLVIRPAASVAPEPAGRPRAVVLLIGDGFGVSQLTFGRNLHAGLGKRLALESLPVVGLVTTYSSSNAVTDSGAAATAMASGVKTDNRYVGTDARGTPVATIADRARARGWRIGYVTTTRITHATPAAFYAHVTNRDDEITIAEQLLIQKPDVALGGGAAFFVPAERGGKRADGRDLLEEARKAGYAVWTRGDSWTDPPPSRLLGLFAADHIAYVLDDRRLPAEHRDPDLERMTRLALDVLDPPGEPSGGGSRAGFLLMVEGGRIDHAGHEFDAAGVAAEVEGFDRAVAAVLEHQKRRPDVLVVLTADHATGGLAINDYVDWEALERQRASLLWIVRRIRHGGSGLELLSEMTGYSDFREEDVKALRAFADDYDAARHVGTLLGQRHGVTWVPKVNFRDTYGHTGEDVPIFAGGPGAERFRGLLDNTDFPRLLADLLGWE
jgi:alkaline phosphatase